MPLPPWVIQELEEERLKREEDARVRSSRIELPQQSPEEAAPPPAAEGGRRLQVFQISPQDENVIDL